MANRRFAETVRAQTAEAIAAGATPLVETVPEDDGGTYLSPQILTNVTHAMRVMSEPKMEIVRPVQKRTNAPLFHIGDVGRRTIGQHTRARRVRERARYTRDHA